MDKNSIIELQKLDCNCNDCKFMKRDQVKFNESLTTHDAWQLWEWQNKRENLWKKADEKYKEQDFQNGFQLENEANTMVYQFNKKECTINFGICEKYNKPISFLPGILQFDTQECFKHRRE